MGPLYLLPKLQLHIDLYRSIGANAKSNLHGQLKQLEIADGAIAPVRLDPNVNLTPLIESEFGGQIQILEWASWSNRKARDAVIFDGDHETAYLGTGCYLVLDCMCSV